MHPCIVAPLFVAARCCACAVVFLVLLCGCVATHLRASEPSTDAAGFFRDKVLPILQQHCYQCHSHESRTIKGGLALDFRSGWTQGGDSGAAIQPGDPDASLLVQAIRRQGDLAAMPPDGALPDEATSVLVEWIRSGAFDDRTSAAGAPQNDWWSLRELRRSPPPELHAVDLLPQAGRANAIDQFIQFELAAHNLPASPPADRRTLMRRLSVDLLGTIPSHEDVAAFEANGNPDAYDRLVDRMLASPAYGERWARHWLDTIHFADTHGFEHDAPRPHAWPYRDYVILRLNSDESWSRFIREQIAADHFYSDQPQWAAALGFLGAGPFDISSFTTAPKTFAYLDRDDMVTQTMAAFASSTVNCARCHAHKFDPISQDDYFALQAVFAGIIKGDIAYDVDPVVAAERQKLKILLEEVDAKSTGTLLTPQWQETIDQWEQQARSEASLWQIADLDTIKSSAGCSLTEQEDHSVLASQPFPEREKYIVRLRPASGRLTALRIEVMSHSSLPASGPGCAVNGNLHLTSIEAALIDLSGGASVVERVSERRPLPIAKASADFDQMGWTAAHAIDGNPETAWGIHPQEGQSHAIIVELAEAIELPEQSQLELTLHQAHGRNHIIGRFRISTSDQANVRLTALTEPLLAALRVQRSARTAEQSLLIAAEALRAHASSQMKKLPPQARVYAASRNILDGNGISAQSIQQPHEVDVLHRGELGKVLRKVAPGALSAISALEGRFEIDPTASESARRAALADWLADDKNPLTWRSLANRVWHYHFGRGLCDTPSDLGRMGGALSHPALLDWLACDVRDGDQSLKRLHRQIVCSSTYRQASLANSESEAIDADNRWLWRQNRTRLDADCYRDAVLTASDGLDRTMGGPAVQHFATSPGRQLTPVVDYSHFDWDSAAGARRSIYRFVWRGIPDPLMEALDFPDLGLLTPRRAQSSSALQALALYNNNFVLANARRLAERVAACSASGEGAKPREQLQQVFRSALQRDPTASELALFEPIAREHGLALVCRVLFNSNEFLFLD